mmetsp:Transcript_70960/g.169952  ORF Transcript_70960/g.169952 Transcript_70960/m.169952 type:complete len:205 (+) Transcript_70960:241-855(+)
MHGAASKGKSSATTPSLEKSLSWQAARKMPPSWVLMAMHITDSATRSSDLWTRTLWCHISSAASGFSSSHTTLAMSSVIPSFTTSDLSMPEMSPVSASRFDEVMVRSRGNPKACAAEAAKPGEYAGVAASWEVSASAPSATSPSSCAGTAREDAAAEGVAVVCPTAAAAEAFGVTIISGTGGSCSTASCDDDSGTCPSSPTPSG